MGGGTVDLIAYRVSNLQPTMVEEITVGNGDQCGGTFIDRAFLKWLEHRLGTEDFVKIAGCRSEDVPRTSLSVKAAKMLQDFTLELKSGFSGIETNFQRLPSPLSVIDDESRGIIDGEIRIEPEDMITMFEFPVRRTYELLLEQLQQARKAGKAQIKYIFMVGGFSESPYVYNKIKTFGEVNDLSVIRPSYAWSAVARGATAKGLEGTAGAILMRKCRRHYGTRFSETFDEARHLECDAFIDVYTGVKRANGQVEWLISKGQELPTDSDTHGILVIDYMFFSEESAKQCVDLIACDDDKAPTRSVYHSVYTVAIMRIDMSKVPKRCKKRAQAPDGRWYTSVDISVHISMQTALEFYCTVNGNKCGTVSVEYE